MAGSKIFYLKSEIFFNSFFERFFSFFLLSSLSFLQALHILALWGINPNLASSAVIAISFFEKTVWLLILYILISLFFLGLVPFFTVEFVIFSGLLILIATFAEYFRNWLWGPALLSILFTLGFYGLTDLAYVLREPVMLFGELLYNLLVVYILVFTVENFILKKD